MNLVDAHDAALAKTSQIVAGIDPTQLSLPTPCDDFHVKALLVHLVDGNHRFVAVAGGASAASVPLDAGSSGTEPTDGWSATYDRSAAAVGEAWRDPAAQERTAELPIGAVPGTVALGMHVVETVVHGWDLAKATGQSTEIDPTLGATAWENVQSITEELRGPGKPFGPAIDTPADAAATDRLIAWLGRTP